MGSSYRIGLLIASVWCLSETRAFNVQRTEVVNGQPVNWEIDLLSDYDRRRFLEDIKKTQSGNTFIAIPEISFKENQASTPRNLEGPNDSTPLDSWSVLWYIASFGGLIIFFLVVSCSEWCCRRARRNNQTCHRTPAAAAAAVPDTPPPSYDEFAPPSYESICLGRQGSEKSKYDIFVVPVHALGTIMDARAEAPPSYVNASSEHFVPALTRQQSQPT